ncbi:MAG: FtsX-like permease family protein [Bacteroidota bacterium]
MNTLILSWKNLADRLLSSLLSLLLLALGVGIISLLLLLNHEVERQFKTNLRGVDLVVGAKGSPLQVILSAIYHIDSPTGNIPLEEAEKLMRHPLIKQAIPLSYGDNYRGYRILGTTLAYLELYKGTIAQGTPWNATLEVVLGAKVAQKTGLSIGDSFAGTHGLLAEGMTHEESKYIVTGILQPNGTVLDQLILTSTESVWAVHEHEEDHEESTSEESHSDAEHENEEADHDDGHKTHPQENHEEDADEHYADREVTSLLVKFRNKAVGIVTMPRQINANTSMQAAVPAIELNRLFNQLGIGTSVLRGVAIAVMLIAALSMFISLYTSLDQRRYELALMRTLGASPEKLASLILTEAMLLSLTGLIVGLFLGHGAIFLLSQQAEAQYAYQLLAFQVLPEEALLAVGVIGLGIVAGLIPALRAANTPISQTLSNQV